MDSASGGIIIILLDAWCSVKLSYVNDDDGFADTSMRRYCSFVLSSIITFIEFSTILGGRAREPVAAVEAIIFLLEYYRAVRKNHWLGQWLIDTSIIHKNKNIPWVHFFGIE